MNIQVPFIIKTEQNDGYNYGEMYQPQMVFPYRPLHLPSAETPHAVQPPDGGVGVENYYYQGYNMPLQIVQNSPQTYPSATVADANNQQTDQTSTDASQFEQMSMDIKRKLVDAGYQYHEDKDKALKPFSCDVCHKSFGRLSHKPFECTICHEKFTRMENRTRHMAIHTGERRFNCDVCGKGFSQLNRLNVHQRIHSGERPFQCEVCGKAFGRIDHKNSHMKTHNWVKIKEEASKQIVAASDAQQSDSAVDPQIPIAVSVRTESSIEQEKVFKCPTCDKMFSRKDHLNRHILIHSGAKPFECDICAKSFSRKDNKYKHMASCLLVNFGIVVKRPHIGVPGANEYGCDPPDFRSLEEKINEKMYEIQCGNIQPITSEADENLDSSEMDAKDADDVEIVLVAPDINLNTNSNEGAYNKDDASSGEPDNDGKEDSCEDLLTPMKTTDENKTVNKSEDGLFRCQVCSKVFLNRNHLNRHAIIHSGVKPFKCDQCDKGFYRMEHLQRHVIIHTGIRPYKCNFCDKSFFQVGDQMKHLMTHINGDMTKAEAHDETVTPDPEPGQPQTFACDKCDKVYTKRSHLKRHYSIHSSQKPFKCNICGQGFSRLEHQKRHMTIHSNQKRYECEFCDKKFNRPDHMLCHIKTHRNVKPYKCNQCGERFETSKEKVEHLRIHSGAYRCEMCHVRFELYVNLIEHRRVVHGILPKSEIEGKLNVKVKVKSTDRYPCPICFTVYLVTELGDHIRGHIDDTADDNVETTTDVDTDNDLLTKVKVEVDYDDDYEETAAISDSMLDDGYVAESEQMNGYDENADYGHDGLIEEDEEDILQQEDDLNSS
ncbi:hypothetical protein HA402_008594 [Bradysia odoriphaga]|nr:hypothetical protein HA402_008594 [Bradysia odoriphaga]